MASTTDQAGRPRSFNPSDTQSRKFFGKGRALTILLMVKSGERCSADDTIVGVSPNVKTGNRIAQMNDDANPLPYLSNGADQRILCTDLLSSSLRLKRPKRLRWPWYQDR